MIQQGVVLEIERDGWAWVLPEAAGGCPHCGAAMSCGDPGGPSSARSVRALNGVRAQPGDRVQIRYGSQSLRLAALVYVVPVGGLILGAAIGNSLGPRLGLSPNTAAILFGIGLLIGCFVLGLVLSKRLVASGDSIAVIGRVLESGPANRNGRRTREEPADRPALARSLRAETLAAVRAELRRNQASS